MDHRFLPIVAAILALPHGVAAAPPVVAWKLETTPELIRLTRGSEPVRYFGAGAYTTLLVLECTTASKQLTARIESEVKTSGSFTTRFDTEPATTAPGPANPEWSNARQHYLLKVPAGDVPRFVSDARTFKRVMVRHEFGGTPYDVTFDLGGVEAAFKPLAEACGVSAPEPRSATAAPRGPKPSPKPDRQVGSWQVRESVSTVDDKLIVVLATPDKLQTMDMYVRCREAAIEAYFAPRTDVFQPDAGEKSVSFDVALDGGAAVHHVGGTTAFFKAAFVEDGRTFARSLVGHKTLALIHKTSKQTATKTVTFVLNGFDDASKDLFAACPGE